MFMLASKKKNINFFSLQLIYLLNLSLNSLIPACCLFQKYRENFTKVIEKYKDCLEWKKY